LFLAHRFLPRCWRRYVLPKHRFLQEPHGVTSQKTAFFIVTAVKSSNLTNWKDLDVGRNIIVQWILERGGGEVLTGFSWLRALRTLQSLCQSTTRDCIRETPLPVQQPNQSISPTPKPVDQSNIPTSIAPKSVHQSITQASGSVQHPSKFSTKSVHQSNTTAIPTIESFLPLKYSSHIRQQMSPSQLPSG
jgi:hypothetical protein